MSRLSMHARNEMQHREGDTVFIKRHGTQTDRDWCRVQYLVNACDATPGLDTARPLWRDAERGMIGYEHLDRLRPTPRDLEQLAKRMLRIGAALFLLHSAPIPAALAAVSVYPLTDFDLTTADTVSLNGLPTGLFHGDCWHGNFFERDTDLVVLDPLPNPHLFKTEHMIACGAIDLATMYMSLAICHPLLRQATVKPARYLEAGEALLQGYFGASGCYGARAAVLRLSRQISLRFISSYRFRLAWPIWQLKTIASNSILSTLDTHIEWKHQ